MDKQKLLDNFIDSMERERTRLGFTQSQMAKELGISLSGYKKLIAGETNKVDLYLAYRLSEISGRYIIDLCGAEGPGLEIVKRLPDLTETQIRFAAGVIAFEADFRSQVASQEAEDYVTMMVPTGNFEDGMIWDSVNLEKVNVAKYRARYGVDIHCAIKITSNHMHPVYHMNDILLVSKQPPRDGDVGIFINKETGRAYLRKYYQTNPIRLVPVNDFGVEYTVDPMDEKDMNQWIKFGKVLAKIR